MPAVRYEVYESDAGILTLVVICRCGHPVYVASGYEHQPGALQTDLKELDNTFDVDDIITYWENNELPNQPGLYETIKYEMQNKLICEGSNVLRNTYPEDMGAAGRLEFDE